MQVIKSFAYRGATQEFSNRYHFDGGVPGDWNALFNAVVALEQYIFPNTVSFKMARGFAPGSDVAVANLVLSSAGLLSSTNGIQLPGDCAAMLKQATTKVSTKNHVVYVFSYYHAAMHTNTNTGPDTLWSFQLSNVQALGDAMKNGFTVGARTYKRTTPDGHLVTSATATKTSRSALVAQLDRTDSA